MDHAISAISSIFHINKKIISIDQFNMPNLLCMPSFIRTRYKLINIRNHKLAAYFYKEIPWVALALANTFLGKKTVGAPYFLGLIPPVYVPSRK